MPNQNKQENCNNPLLIIWNYTGGYCIIDTIIVEFNGKEKQ